jgi:hypothetical protein
MDKDFRLTSSEYARLLGISGEALRSRRRRNQEDGNFIEADNKFWWKTPSRDRPLTVKTATNDRAHDLGPGTVPSTHATPKRKRRRGAMLRGEQTNYHNASNGFQLEELNRIRALGKIRDSLGDEVVDEITPELFDLAKKNVQKKKDDEFKKQINRSMVPDSQFISGLDQTPTRYGTRLNQQGLNRVNRNYQNRLNRKWEYSTKVKFLDEPGKRHLPDFSDTKSGSRFGSGRNNYYEIGNSNDGSIEVEPRSVIQEEPEHKNKVEEYIYRLKTKGY